MGNIKWVEESGQGREGKEIKKEIQGYKYVGRKERHVEEIQ